MRAVVTRVDAASVSIGGKTAGEIGAGLLILLGIAPDDTAAHCRKLADKILGLRIFPDGDGKMNRALADIGGSRLTVHLVFGAKRLYKLPFGAVALAELLPYDISAFTYGYHAVKLQRRLSDRHQNIFAGNFPEYYIFASPQHHYLR